MTNSIMSRVQTSKHFLVQVINRVLSTRGFRLTRDSLSGEFDVRIEKAREAGMDVNDWLEQELGWKSTEPVVDEMMAYVKNNAVICEIGAGTGRQSRLIAERLKHGQLHLVEKSEKQALFLKDYFHSKFSNISVYKCNGLSFPFFQPEMFDMVFSHGTFIYLKLGVIYRLSREISHIVKPEGFCMFNYLDINKEEAWDYLEEQSQIVPECFEYYPGEVIERIFGQVHFNVVKRHNFNHSVILTLQKSQKNTSVD